MAFCTQCGNENRAGARFCRFCGQVIIEEYTPTTESYTVDEGGNADGSTVKDTVAEPGLPVAEATAPVQEAPPPDLAEESITTEGEQDLLPLIPLDQEFTPMVKSTVEDDDGLPGRWTSPDGAPSAIPEVASVIEQAEVVLEPSAMVTSTVLQAAAAEESPVTEDDPGLLDVALAATAVEVSSTVKAGIDRPDTVSPLPTMDFTVAESQAVQPSIAETLPVILPAGHILQGRYHIVGVIAPPASTSDETAIGSAAGNAAESLVTVDSTTESGLEPAEGSIVYDAEDWQRCWNCDSIQSDLQPRYCEMCGAELINKPHVRITARYLGGEESGVADEQVQDSEAFSRGEVFIEHTVLGHGVPASTVDVLYQVEMPAAQVAEPVSAPQIRLVNGVALNTGQQRTNNEDSLLALHLTGQSEVVSGESAVSLGLYVVADGVGGHALGEVASGTAIRSMGAGIMQHVFIPECSGEALTQDVLEQRFKEVVLAANQAILDLRTAAPSTAAPDNDMGCTITAALVRGSLVGKVDAIVLNVGDSRTYLMRQGKLQQVTLDHSVVARMVEQGVIQPDEIYTHEQRNMIYRSLGDKPDLIVDGFRLELQIGDRLLLCSDGLWEMVRDPIMEDVLLERYDPQQACEKLVELANLSGGVDNISVIVVDIQEA